MLIWAGGGVSAAKRRHPQLDVKGAFLTGIFPLALAIVCPPPALAAQFTASNDAQLRAAIIAAGAHADASSTITLTGNIVLTNAALPTLAKPLTIQTNGHTLTGAPVLALNDGRIELPTAGQALNLDGNFVGGTSGPAGTLNGGEGFYTGNNAGGSAITNNGSITGGAAGGNGGSGGNGATMFNAVITNNGSITGGDATLLSGGLGIILSRGASLINYGLIQGGDSVSGAGGWGIRGGSPAGGLHTITNHGVIQGGEGPLNGGGSGAGILASTGTGLIVNTGTVRGGTNAYAIGSNVGLDIINSGNIIAGAGQINAIALNFATQVLNLELQAGSAINGNVVAGTGGTDLFRLGGAGTDSFDVSTIGVQYQNFDTLQKTGVGTWSLVGAGTHAAPWQIVAGTLQIGNGGTSGSIVSDVTNNATLAFNRSDALTYGGIISGTGVVNQVGSGKTILTGANTYTGATNVQAGTLIINGNQTGATGLTSVFSGASLGGIGVIGGNLTAFAGGVIAPGNSIGTLTVNGNYTSNGGKLEVEAQLGGDASPADLLLINGNSLLGLAPTLVQVINVGGLGGVATNGIKIVDVVGVTSDAGAFVLNGPAIGGAYAYKLFQNDLATGTDGDWYLRSAGLAPTTPTLGNYPVALLGMTDLPTLRQRVGDRVEAADGVWSRIEGGAGHYEASNTNTAASYDSSLFLAQFGVEGALVDGAGGSLVAGFSTQYSRNAATVFSGFGNGSNVTEALGIGATLTWRGAGGTYLDLQGQLAKFWTDLDAVGYRLVTDNGGTGLAVSLEAGHEIALDDAWSLTPQAQLSYASVGFDRFTDRFGSVISLEAGNSLKGRVGVGLDYRTDLPDQKASASISGVANLTYEFLDGATVAVSGTNLHYAAQKFGAELGLGGTLEWNGGAQVLHAEVLGATSFQGSHALKGTLGFTAGF